MISQAIKQQVQRVFDAYAVRRDAVVLLCVDPTLDKRYVKPLLESVISMVGEGCVCIVGDCSFNTNEQDVKSLRSLTNQERLVLAADYPLQLLSLRQDSILARHPSLSMGGVGKMAKFIFRHSHLDFPYDKPSAFSDLEDLNAFFLCVGNVYPKFALKYADSTNPQRVIKKESCVYNNELLSYLDFECDFKAIDDNFYHLDEVSYDAEGYLDIYSGWYSNIIIELRKSSR
ncbi:hypothetical protein AOC36_03180 [Erysipelothrix larvae]|uniref:Aminoglycoside N(3)-acetyltransferase n=1 Tax=Erysipelothrix larvae TaxID=1514105 RepID=A0A120JTI8_9FIRM|nr:AAC(3) family N-acetyltransferase [Erysipelothrix larvae]AMC93018.1 hypothetical protein AOC36_03180 [Erysipelothrix larvae]